MVSPPSSASGLMSTDLTLEYSPLELFRLILRVLGGYRDRRNPVNGDRSKNAIDFRPEAGSIMGLFVGVVLPLPGGELDLYDSATTSPPADCLVRGVDSNTRTVGTGEETRGGVSSPMVGSELIDSERLREYASVGTGLSSKHAQAHGSRTPSPLVSVNRRFFKLGSVCRMSSARRLRFAISYQNKRKRVVASPNQRKHSPSRCSYLVRTPRTQTERFQHPWKKAETCVHAKVNLTEVRQECQYTRTYIRGPNMLEIPSLIRLRLPTHVIGYTSTSPK